MQPQIDPVREANHVPRFNSNWHEWLYFYLLVQFWSDFVRIFIKKFQTLSEVKIDINLLCKYLSLPNLGSGSYSMLRAKRYTYTYI